MLPYEILLGFRGTMCTCAQRLITKQNSLRKFNYKIQNLHSASNILTNNTSHLYLNNIKRFHTNLSANCFAVTKDSKPIEETNNKLKLDKSSPGEIFASLTNQFQEKDKFVDFDHNEKTVKKIPESVKTWIFSTHEKTPAKEIEKRFPEPKAFLHNLYAVVINETKNKLALQTSCKPVNVEKKRYWSFTYTIQWPESQSFTTLGLSKASASTSAALKCLYWLHLQNRIKNRLPVVYEKKETLSLLHAPEEINVDKKILDEVNTFLNKFEDEIEKELSQGNSEEIGSLHNSETVKKQHPISFKTVDPYRRNEILKERFEKLKDVSKPDLPIFLFKSQILKELEENQAVVIKGDTGCGKTTQVPQFIIDHYSEKGEGSDCKMIVTEPRRISAISLAERIAFERNEKIGDVVGYQVRLQQVLPQQNGAILFCTTGILLKKLQSNLGLENCSHIIVDEAHERSVDTDMLLVLLKRGMKLNPKLKVVIMSATINADLFQNYLQCNAVEVPGRLFPVQMHFLDDMANLGIPMQRRENVGQDGEPIVDCNQISELIKWITKNKPPGAILCFLPGWSQINKIQMILDDYPDLKKVVIPLHSRIPYLSQSKIFEPVPSGIRKIILATDIAETGITVPDVVYVIDSACHKQISWHENKGLSSIDTHWISKANMDQRKGRAGRVQSGESYHFITKKMYDELEAYPLPEVLRVSLEKTVLDGKTYSNEKAENFLGSMPQPPRLTAVKKAVNDLQTLGALNDLEELTPLGRRIALFTIHPKLSKAMVYSTIFQCLSPVTTISAALSLDSEIFHGSLENKGRIRELKKRFHPTSDHLSIAWIYSQWLSFFEKGYQYAKNFCFQNKIHYDRIQILHKVRDINLDHLRESGLIDNVQEVSNLQSKENEYAVLDELVRGVLLAGMDQILKHRNFEFKKGRFTQHGFSMVTEDNAKAQTTTECVNYKRQSWPSSFLIYYQKTHHHEMRTTLIRESSIISPVTVLLFSQGRVNGSLYKGENQTEEKVLLRISGKLNVNLICDQQAAQTLLRFRDLLWSVVRHFVDRNVSEFNEIGDENNIVVYKKELLEVLAKLLNSASNSIDFDAPQKSGSGLYSDDDERCR